jgi:hypothetical protein
MRPTPVGPTAPALTAPVLAPPRRRGRARSQPTTPRAILVYALAAGLHCGPCYLASDELGHPQLTLPQAAPRCVRCGRAIH